MPELKNCPFCGSNGELQENTRWKFWHISCVKCRACGEIKQTGDAAIKVWNKRYGEGEADVRRPFPS